MKHRSCWGFFGFQEAMSEPAGKAKKPTACHLMPHNKHLGKQGCNFQFRKHKIFNPWKTRSVNFRPSALFTCNCIQFYIIICCWVVIRYFICCLVFVFDYIFFLFCCFKFILLSVRSVHQIIQYSITEYYFCPDIGNVFQVFRSPLQQPPSKSINITTQDLHLLLS
jgi:hypothetical protein